MTGLQLHPCHEEFLGPRYDVIVDQRKGLLTSYKATRQLLATDLVALIYGQVTLTTPELSHHGRPSTDLTYILPFSLSGSTAQGGPWPSEEAFSRPAFFLLVFSNS
ncbi:hypothetical protein TNCV_4634451 [Trichonephila clavipes]|nr:hypothetical protein TNCV_4634451 [Trichonephila clavipes]